MADTASLVARVKSEGAEAAAKQLDDFAKSAGTADTAVQKLTPNVVKFDNAARTAAKSGMPPFRTAAQQVGYQLQDVVVQLQSGTSAFVAIGQQGSQLAGAFGPGGAVVGAFIALGAAAAGVYSKMKDAEDGALSLEDANKRLKDVLQETSSGALTLSDDLLKLASSNIEAAKAQLAAAMAAAATQITKAGEAAAQSTEQFDSFFNGSVGDAIGQLDRLEQSGKSSSEIADTLSSRWNSANASALDLYGVVSRLTEGLGLTTDQALGLVRQLDDVQRTKSPETVKALAASMADLAAQNGVGNSRFNEFNNIIQQAVVQMNNGADAAATMKAAMATLGTQAQKFAADTKAQAEAYVSSIEMQTKRGADLIAAQTDQQIKEIEKRNDLDANQRERALAAARAAGELELKEFRDRETKKTESHASQLAKREEAQKLRAEREAERNKQAAENFISTIQRQGSDEIANINATESQRLAKLEEFRQKGLIVDQAYEDAKTQIQMSAEDKRQEELDKRQKEAQEKQNKHDDFIAAINEMNASELELIDQQEQAKAEIAAQYRDEGLISEQEYQDALAEIAAAANKRRRDQYASVLGQTTDDLRAALGEGNKMYKAFAIANAIMNTYQGAVAAFQSAAAIPIVGWVAAPIAAAAAVAAGLANVAKIRSAREQGGNLSVGQMSTIAERGKPEVIMPASASRVRTAQQMRQIMGENSGSNQPTNVQIVNQTTGRIDSATTDRMDENTLRVIIRETVSSDLANSNSSISKTRRGTRGQPGF